MDTCSLCCDESQAWAVGLCDHATCLLCSVRLRLLCEQRECPVCREKLNKVVVSDSIKKFSLPPYGSKVDRKYGYFFRNSKLYDKYKSLLLYQCIKCREKPTFSTFNLLRDHSRKVHSLVYCDICCENLKLFPYELRQYTRQELTRHRREGDPDDRSYKGHPLCQFCDNRFYDNDALHAHLRKVHFWCHFCESDGKQDYYSTYHLLRNHFKQEHYLCVDGDCQQEKFTSVFRTKLDIQVHRAKVHTKGVTKAEAKQMRQLDVGFTYGRVEEPRSVGESFGGGSVNNGRGYIQQQRGGSRMNKARECDEKSIGNIQLIPAPQQQQQQQHDTTKSPQLGRRKKKTSASASYQHTYEQPPRLKQKQEQYKPQQTKQQQQQQQKQSAPEQHSIVSNKVVGTSSNDGSKISDSIAVTTAGSSQAKKPPGLKSPPATKNNTSTTDKTSEWPDLLTLSIVSKEQPKTTSVERKLNPHNVNYNPSQFPPLDPIAPPSSSNINFAASSLHDYEEPSVGSNVPPGFMMPRWQTIQQDSIYKTAVSSNHMTMSEAMNTVIPQQRVVTEGSVINMVRDALGHNREKFNYFRNLSGWYRNSEITVQDYVRRCQELFGDLKWMLIGPQLAQVMPIEGKRNELIQNVCNTGTEPTLSDYIPTSFLPTPEPLPLPGPTSSGLHVSRSLKTSSNRWGNRVVPNLESKCDYPSLHTQNTTTPSSTGLRRQIQPPGLPAHSCWKARVPV